MKENVPEKRHRGIQVELPEVVEVSSSRPATVTSINDPQGICQATGYTRFSSGHYQRTAYSSKGRPGRNPGSKWFDPRCKNHSFGKARDTILGGLSADQAFVFSGQHGERSWSVS